MPDLGLDVPGARLAYEVYDGAGPTVVALHGFTSSRAGEDRDGHFGWRAVAAAGRRLVRYDARGHGASTGRPEPADWRWSNLARDLLAVLDVVSADAPVDAIGVSMGVGTILSAAVLRPERFRRLALVIPPTAWRTRAAQGAIYDQAAGFVERHGLDAYVRGTAALPPLPILEAAGVPTFTPPDIPQALVPSAFRGAGASDLPDAAAVAALTQPVLLAPWTGDPGHPVSTAERLTELLPDATLWTMSAPADLRALGARVAAFLA